MLSRPYHYGAASTAHRSDDYYSHRIDRELKYKSSFAHEGYNRDRRYDNRERNGRRSVDSHVMGKTNAARYGRRFAPYEHSATSQWREKQSRSGGLHTSDRSLEINGGASKSSAAQEHVRDQDVVVASRSENVRHSSGKKLASAIVTPSRIALDDTNVTVRGHEIVRSMTFSPTEKAMQQSPKGDDLVIDALKDMDIAGIGEKDQHAMTMDCDEDDLLGAELETMEDVECVQESSSRSAARMDRPGARSSRSRSRSRVPLGLQSTKARLLSKGSPMKRQHSSSSQSREMINTLFLPQILTHGFGLECVQYAIFDGPTYEWVVISRQPNIICKLRFCSTSRCMHMVLAVVCLMREGEKDIGAVHTSSWGQRRVASTASRLACYSTRAEALRSDYVFDESSGCFRTKEDPQLYYAPTKPLEEGTSEAEQHVGAYILRMEVSHETRSEYQKEIEEPYMGNVEKEQKVANNSKPNSGNYT
uniref:Uncharacterized protein n=1 Tax=Brassica oleracea var. oleracea TaxID=109376 RepID=A0A0D3DLN9_BRAOL